MTEPDRHSTGIRRMFEPNLSCAVLAGGASSRMGRDKSLLMLDGKPMIERCLDRLSELSNDLIVVSDETDKYEFLRKRVRFAGDIGGGGQGPLAGIAGALVKARYSRVLVVATDMPFLNVDLLRFLARVDPPADVVVPVLETSGHPETLHAIYAKSALHAIQNQLIEGRRKITQFFDQVHVTYVPGSEIRKYDPEFLSFLNTNTPDDWARIQRLSATE